MLTPGDDRAKVETEMDEALNFKGVYIGRRRKFFPGLFLGNFRHFGNEVVMPQFSSAGEPGTGFLFLVLGVAVPVKIDLAVI
jgi:hypothetical protein